MTAHRRPGLRADTPSDRRAAPVRRRRRVSAGPLRRLPLLLSIAVVVVTLAAAAVVGGGLHFGADQGSRKQITYAAGRPREDPALGLVYQDLQPAADDALCAGAFELPTPQTCTHGPDPAPAGLAANADVPPVTVPAAEPSSPAREPDQVPSDAEVVRDEGGTALAVGQPALVPDAAPGEADFILGSHGIACEADGHAGNRVQVLYLHEFGTPSRYSAYLGSIWEWSARVDTIFDDSAAETGGSRHIRFVTTPQCRIDIAEVQVPAGSLDSFPRNIQALQRLGYNRTDRKYLIFADTHVYCGIGTFIADQRPGLGNRNNGGPSYGRIDAGCWGAPVAAHELTYMLGASLKGSPNSDGAGNCTDEYDLLCAGTRAAARAGDDEGPKRPPVRAVCPKSHELRLDCNHDDYFSTSPKPGSYLAKNWNVAQSEFLLQSDGGDDVPGAPPAQPAPGTANPGTGTGPGGPATATGSGDGPPPTAENADPGAADPNAADPNAADPNAADPNADDPGTALTVAGTPGGDGATTPTDTVAAPVQAVLEIRDPTSTAVRLTWSAASPDATYEVAVDGVTVATTKATRARLIGLRPDASYQVTVRNAALRYTARGKAQTVPAARPTQNTWFILTNSLTGGAADLYAARTASGTPIVLNGAEGGAQQQWRLARAGADAFFLQSRATGKCVVPLGGNPVAGAPLVQADCTAEDSQRWLLRLTTHGFSLNTTVGGLVLGVGSQRFGAHRLLVLQRPAQARHQSWTAVPD